MTHPDSFGARSTLSVGDDAFEVFRLDALQSRFDVARLPYTLRILLENVLRREDGVTVTGDDVEAVATWNAAAEPSREITFAPARVLLQDFTGVPAVVDLAAMRDAMAALGGDPSTIDPLIPAELVIDHSVQVDDFASRLAIRRNAELEFKRNRERYAFLRWGQGAFDALKVVPPNTGICHQVNLEFLARVVESRDGQAFPDTLVGTDSHTTMINGLGVLGWGVGGIEAEAAMLGEAISMLVPQVVGFRLHGQLPEGATATDLVLTVTQILRQIGVVGKFVEYFGEGLLGLPLADRATIGNMSPEYGATCGFFPVDDETLRYLRLTGRSDDRVALVEAYCKENLLWHDPSEPATYSQVVELDLSSVEPSLAGPRRPQDRIALSAAKVSFLEALPTFGVDYGNAVDEAVAESFPASDPPSHSDPGAEMPAGDQAVDSAPVAVVPTHTAGIECELDGQVVHLAHGAVVIAAITSCTNTSNPSVMVAAGLLAKNAVERGLDRRPWVKSSLAPGSKVVSDYFDARGPDAVPRGARVPHGRLRLHDVHRELGPAARARLEGDRRGRSRRVRGALGQPQLRGARAPRGEGELPREPAARRRVRARGSHGRRPRRPSRSATTRTASRCTSPISGLRPTTCARPSRRRSGGRCSSRPTRTSTPATPSGGSWRSPPEISMRGTMRRPTSGARRTSTACPRASAPWTTSRSALPRLAGRLGHDRPHLAGGVDQAGQPRPVRISSRTASNAPTSTPTARAAATTR